jgi:hypothetical protein
MEEEWIADRQHLRRLLATKPEWTRQDLADATGRSLAWVKMNKTPPGGMVTPTSAASKMIQEGTAEEGGRPARSASFNAHSCYFINQIE